MFSIVPWLYGGCPISGYHYTCLAQLKTLFTPAKEPRFSACPEVVVGPLAFSKWRHASIPDIARRARQKLSISEEPVIYFFPSPAREAPSSLHVLGYILNKMVSSGYLPQNAVLLLNRHRREMNEVNRFSDSAGGFNAGLRYLAEVVGLKVFDNSPEYARLPAGHPYRPLPEFSPLVFLDYQEMLAVTAGNGAALTFFGTDGLMVAPFLCREGVFPILWLDPSLGGRVLLAEKKITRFNFLFVEQPDTERGLSRALTIACHPRCRATRDDICRRITTDFPFPGQEPEKKIVQAILNDLKG
jgi:hypothetical protein